MGRIILEEETMRHKKHIDKVFKQGFILAYGVIHGPAGKRAESWRKLLALGQPSNFTLLRILREAPYKWQRNAWEVLKDRDISNSELLRVSPNPTWSKKIYGWVMRQNPTNLELHKIANCLYSCIQEIGELACDIIINQNPSTDDLCFILVETVHAGSDAHAWELLAKKGPSQRQLSSLVLYARPEWREKASEALFNTRQNGGLGFLVQHGSRKWRRRAWAQLIKQRPSCQTLTDIMTFAPRSWGRRARILIKQLGLKPKRKENPDFKLLRKIPFLQIV